MNTKAWFAARGAKFVVLRASKLVSRYGISAQRSTNRITDSMQTLAKFGCAPTFFTPGSVVERHSQFIQGLQSEGAEIGVHSYQHIDLSTLRLAEAIEQLKKAVRVFEQHGIENRGFRCPYLGYSDELLDALPAGMFSYSSNRAIWVGVPALDRAGDQNLMFNTLHRFYRPRPSSETISTPWVQPNLFEIPVCVPDDIQLHDGLFHNSEGISQAWIEMLHQTHQRGELFNLIFHPELGSICSRSFDDLLQQAKLLKPAVWIARLRDISDWWKEKSGFKVDINLNSNELLLEFSCTPRATILARGLGPVGSERMWDGAYYRLPTKTLVLPADQRPFVGLHGDAPKQVVSFLKEQGYIVQSDETASSCGVYIDAQTLSRFSNQVQMIDYIETSSAPLVRFWRWPDGAKSALCVTGDLDALTLFDYAARLFVS